jgi:hypothetical protein
VNKVFGLIGTSFGLIALYLVLSNSEATVKGIGALSRGYVDIAATLQGRRVVASDSAVMIL